MAPIVPADDPSHQPRPAVFGGKPSRHVPGCGAQPLACQAAQRCGSQARPPEERDGRRSKCHPHDVLLLPEGIAVTDDK